MLSPHGLLFLLLHPPALPQTLRPQVEVVKLSSPMASGVVPGWSGSTVLSPDGTRALFLQSDQGATPETRLFVRPLDASTPPVWLDSGPIVLPRWSPDGARIVYAKAGPNSSLTGLHSVASDGSGAPVLLVALGAGTDLAGYPLDASAEDSLAITADSTRVVARLTSGGSAQLFGIPLVGGPLELLNAPLTSGGNVQRVLGATVGDTVVFLADALVDERYELFAVPADGSAPPLPLGSLGVGQSVSHLAPHLPTLAPLGQHVLFHQNPIGGATPSGFHAARTDASAPSVQLASVAVGYLATPDGTGVVHFRRSGAGREHVWSVPVDGSAPATILASVSIGTVFLLGLSPDGANLFAVNSGGPTQLVTARIDGTGDATLLGHAIDLFQPPRFSPDSSRLAFLETSLGVQSMPSDGSQAPVLVLPYTLPFTSLQLGFRLTDEAVIAHGNLLDSTRNELVVAPLAVAGTPQRLNPPLGAGLRVEDFVVTPDGDFVLASYNALPPELAEGPAPLHRLRVDLSETLEFQEPFPVEVIGDVRQYAAHAGRAVYLADQDTARVVELYSRLTSGAGAPTKLNGALVAGGDVLDFRLSRDGRTVIFLADALVDGKNELFSVPSDGSAAPIRLNAAVGADIDVDSFELSPDGRVVVYHDTRLPPRIRSVLTTGGTVVNLANASPPFEITPDSTRVLFHPGGLTLSSVAIIGGASVDLTGGRSVSAYRITPDGTRAVLLASEDGEVEEFESLYSVPLTGGTPLRLATTAVPDAGIVDFALSAERVVFVGDLLVDEEFRCFSAPLDASAPAVLVSTGLGTDTDAGALALDDGGTRVVYVAAQELQLGTYAYQLFSAPIDGGASPLLLAADPLTSLGSPRVLEGGRVLFQNGTTLRTVPLLGGLSRTILSVQGPWRYELSSEEQRVVFFDANALRSVPVRGGAVTTLAAPVTLDVLLRFQQDGPAVLFTHPTDGVLELYASHFRPGTRQAATPTETRTR